MFGKVIVGLDGRTGGEDALALARRLADPGGELLLCEVVVVDHHPSRATNRDYESVEVENARERLAAVCVRVEDLAASTRATIADSAARGLCELAAREQADLIVIGACQRSAIGRLLAGNDALQTLHHASCPVALAPADYRKLPAAIERIGVGYNESTESELALALALALRSRMGAKLEVTEVLMPPWPVDIERIGTSLTLHDERMEAEARLLANTEIDESTVTISANATRELRNLAERCQLLVIGARPRTSFGRVLFATTSDALTHGLACPLLAVPRSTAMIDGQPLQPMARPWPARSSLSSSSSR